MPVTQTSLAETQTSEASGNTGLFAWMRSRMVKPKLIIDDEFRRLIPPLASEELAQLESNQLGFTGTRAVDGNVESLDLWPTNFGPAWWIWSYKNLQSGIEEYSKRPVTFAMVCRAMPLSNWKGFNLKAVPREPLSSYPPVASRAIPPTTFVYFIQGVDGGPVKIGHATSPTERLATFQCGSPVVLRIVKLLENADESELHKKYAKYRLHGEWFSPEIMEDLP